MNAVGYIRRSTSDLQPQSLDDQQKAIAAYAQEHGFEVMRWYEDDGISGTETRQRPGFMQMIADAQDKKDFAAVLVWSQDRFSRLTADETGYFRTLLKNAGVCLISITETWLNGEDIGSRIARNAMQEVKHEYVRDMARSVIRGQHSNIMQAKSDPGRRAPYGYDRLLLNTDGTIYQRVRWLSDGTREIYTADGKLQRRVEPGTRMKKEKGLRAMLAPADAQTVKTVQEIFRLSVEGAGFKAVAEYLNGQRIPAPEGGWWVHTGVKAILQNHAYKGAICWNKRSEGKFFQASANGQARVRSSLRTASGRIKTIDNPESEWVILENAHEAIVQPEIWDRAQEAVKQRSRHRGGKGKKNAYALSGLIYCANCGKPFWGFQKQSGKKANGHVTKKFYYSCAGYHSSGKHSCVSVHVPADDYEGWLLAQIKALVFSQDKTVENAVKRFVAEVGKANGSGGQEGRLKEIEREKRHIRDTVEAMLKNIAPENMIFINGKLGELRQRLENLDAEARKVQKEQPKQLDPATLREFAYSRLSRLHEAVTGQADTEATRQVLAGYVAKIEVDPLKRCIDTYVYRDSLPFLPAANAGDLEDKPDGIDFVKSNEKPELACANPGFSKCGRGDRI